MAQVREALTPAAVARLGSMELRARAIVEGHYSGRHRSPYRGVSVEFADHREYAPGDETRHIDWKVYARRDRLFLKQHEAETNLNVYLLVDVSRSMDYGAPVRKLDYAGFLAAGLAYLAVRQRDAVGLALVDHDLRLSLAPQSTAMHLQAIFDALEGAEPGRDTDLSAALEVAAAGIRRRGLVVLISDLLDDAGRLGRALGYFRHRGHDVVALQVLDGAELEFDLGGLREFEDLETGRRVTADAQDVRAGYLRALGEFLSEVRETCRSRHIDHELMDTRRPFSAALTAYLGRRAQMR